MEKVLNILNDLNDIEEKACSIVDHTSIEKKALYKQMTDDIKKLEDSIAQETEKKLEAIRDKMRVEIEAAKKDLLASFEADMQKVESNYQKNHDIFVEAIFQKIISE
ncbi:MAG: hypothetical protein PWP24_1264 [Clostridiales bacterium]|nr:hypothetical protein [Clostridiales bacterium]